jgi:anti-sigma factor RsiW
MSYGPSYPVLFRRAADYVDKILRGGFNLVPWAAGGLMFWAVSDLNLKELQEFRDAFGERAPI